MKTGAILYFAGDLPVQEEIEVQRIAEDLGIQADRLALVSKNTGYQDVIDAWWMLLTRGMKRVLCFAVSSADGQTFNLVSQPLRLCG